MAKIIAVNAGSSSLKFQLLEMPSQDALVSGVVERIGMEDAIFSIKFGEQKVKEVCPILDHEVAVNMLLEALTKYEIISSLEEIDAVGHRVVHGGEKYAQSVIITDEVEKEIEALSSLAPLHNPANLIGYRAFKKNLNVGHVAVFDTAFHQTMAPEIFLYPIPYEMYTKYGIRKYGFHGTSHYYVSKTAIEFLGNPAESKIITCHLGNGASICAVKNGVSVNTSMGFTPLAGVMMGTRSGDIDPSIVPFLVEKMGVTAQEVGDILNKKSGMLGIYEKSNDARDIEDGLNANDARAELTLAMYADRIVQTVGGYIAQLGGVDAIVFTAGIGENGAIFRQAVCDRLKGAFNIDMDTEANKVRSGEPRDVSTATSSAKILVIPTDEELVIVQDTVKLLNI